MSTTFDPIAAVTSGFDAGRGADPAFVVIPVPPEGASQPDVRPPTPGDVRPSASCTQYDTVTTREHYDVEVGKPGPSDPRGNASRGPKPQF